MSDEATALLTRTAALLLANGQTTEGARIAVERLALAQGRPVHFTVRWGEFALQAQDGTILGEIAPTGVDVGRVVATEAVVDAVCAGRAKPGESLARLEAIERSGPVSLARFALMAAAGAAALGVIFGAQDWLTIVMIAASAGLGALVRRAAFHASSNPFLQPLVASLLAGLIGGLVERSGLAVAIRLVVVCPCMVLVPGPHFLNGTIDLVRARIPIGAGRVSLALLIVLTICGGLLSGLALTNAAFPQASTLTSVPLPYDVLAAGVAVAAYGSFFNMPWRLTVAPVIIGMAAHAVHWRILQQGASLQAAAFGAALLVGGVSAPLASRFRMAFGASAFSAVVSLVPGVLMFDTASATLAATGIRTKMDPATLLAIFQSTATAAFVVIALAAGLIIPKMIFDTGWNSHSRRWRHEPIAVLAQIRER